MTRHNAGYGRLDPPYVYVVLTEKQWDVVRDACYKRGTKQATKLGERIWGQGGGTS